jgi:succinate dehydrogenase / fumarate reductase cytochrome b subunit
MSESATSAAKKRPEFRNINAFTDLPSYRLPVAGIVSILHRISGFIMFGLPGFLWKLVALGLIWAYLHHFIAGVRHLWMDTHHDAVSKEFGKSSAIFTLAASVGLTVILGAKLFGLY